jgi:hypothetical protein
MRASQDFSYRRSKALGSFSMTRAAPMVTFICWKQSKAMPALPQTANSDNSVNAYRYFFKYSSETLKSVQVSKVGEYYGPGKLPIHAIPSSQNRAWSHQVSPEPVLGCWVSYNLRPVSRFHHPNAVGNGNTLTLSSCHAGLRRREFKFTCIHSSSGKNQDVHWFMPLLFPANTLCK